jgi:AraC-like DNA-binding protein
VRFGGPGGEAADALWAEVARPAGPGTAGATMAGFRSRADVDVDLLAVPPPVVMLAIEFGADDLVVADAAGRQRRGSIATGLAPGPVRARASALSVVQVRLSPVAAQAVLGVPPGELSGAVVALDDLWGPDVARIQERLHAATTWADRFAIVDAALARRRAEHSVVSPEVLVAWRRIVAGRGRVRVDGLADELGWSRKRLWSRFRAQVGLSPKRAAELVRFDLAAHRLAAGESPARVAADAGYADQSHLHREVRGFAGITPGAVAAQPWLAVDEVAWPVGPR